MGNYGRVLSRGCTGSGVNIRNTPLGSCGDELEGVRLRKINAVREDEAGTWNEEEG